MTCARPFGRTSASFWTSCRATVGWSSSRTVCVARFAACPRWMPPNWPSAIPTLGLLRYQTDPWMPWPSSRNKRDRTMTVAAKRPPELPPGVRADGKPRKDLARKALPVNCEPGATRDDVRRKLAALATSPEFTAYRVVFAAERKSGIGDSLDVPALLEILRLQAAAAKGNDLAQAEAMLMNQASALQSLFGRLAERGMGCNDVPAFEANMRVALRAQAQCRATLETLAALKNPPVVFARQANIAAGPQQVNNAAALDPSCAREDL